MGDLIGGYNNHMVVSLGYQGDIVGGGSSAAVGGMKFYLPMSAQLTHVSGSITGWAGSGSSAVNVLAGATKVLSTGLAFSSGVLSGTTTAVKSSYALSAAGTIFSLCETTTSGTLSNLSVQLSFRPKVD